MKIKLAMFVMMIFSLVAAPASLWAHVVNDQNLYEDIALSQAKEKIVYLSGLGVIAADHGAPLFKPKDMLTRQELAYWAGSFLKLQAASKDPQGIAKAAEQKGIVKSLQGNATYGDVSLAFFQNQAASPQPGNELTKEEFAMFVSEHWQQAVNGRTLFEMAGATKGPSGKIEAVSVSEVKDSGGQSSKVYTLKINGTAYSLSAHPKIVNASVDPSVWEGKQIWESWLMTTDGNTQQLNLITFEQQSGQVGSDKSGGMNNGAHAGHDNHTAAQASGDPSGFPILPVVGGAILVVAVIWLFLKK